MGTTNLQALIQRLNSPCQKALEAAAGLCLSRTHYTVELEHWFIKLIDSSDNDLMVILPHYEIDAARLAADLSQHLDRFKTGNNSSPALSQNVIDLAREAWLLASLQFNATLVQSSHLLAALLTDSKLSQFVRSMSIEFTKIPAEPLLTELPQLLQKSSESAGSGSDIDSNGHAAQSTNTPALDKYTQDLTQQAREGKIDPVLGRDLEIRQITDILTRRRQNNPILTGEAGVGKTAVVEGFALRIATGDVPPALKNVSVCSLDLGLLQAGAGVKGEFENRLKEVINEIKSSVQPIILFIDEAHTLIGAGGQVGQGDAANMLKPALARGELRTIAATTWAEYKKYFEKDAALTRRFQVVKVDEPDDEKCIAMMRGLAKMLEKHHQIRILDEAIVDSVRLAKRYVSDRQLPDKSVSVLDTACAKVAMSHHSVPAAIEDCKQQINQIETQRELLERESARGIDHQKALQGLLDDKHSGEQTLDKLQTQWELEKACVLKIRNLGEALESQVDELDETADELGNTSENIPSQGITRMQAEYQSLVADLKKIQGENPLIQDCVNGQSIAEVVSSWTGIPLGRMLRDEIQSVLGMKTQLAQRIIGQEYALDVVSQNIQSARAKLTDPGKPIGVFLFVGTSGVGKTETALALAELLYGDEKNIITINMSEFKEEHKISILAGAPPGYVGYGEGGVLTEAVRRKPYSLVLLDEMEKAHPSIQDVFYQVFDKGIMRDGEGRDVNFKNTTIILTSNAGTDLITKLCADPETAPDVDSLREALKPELLKIFKPAFLGRVKVVPFFPLNDESLHCIVKQQLARVQGRLRFNYQAQMTYDESLIDSIAKRCMEVETGARTIDHILTGTLLPQLSVKLLARLADEKPVNNIHVGIGEDAQFTYQIT